MSRTEVVTRACPNCGTKLRIPVVYEFATYDPSDISPWKLGRGHGCPSGCELTDSQMKSLV